MKKLELNKVAKITENRSLNAAKLQENIEEVIKAIENILPNTNQLPNCRTEIFSTCENDCYNVTYSLIIDEYIMIERNIENGGQIDTFTDLSNFFWNRNFFEKFVTAIEKFIEKIENIDDLSDVKTIKIITD